MSKTILLVEIILAFGWRLINKTHKDQVSWWWFSDLYYLYFFRSVNSFFMHISFSIYCAFFVLSHLYSR